jgi:hypothetical protein
MSVGLSDLVVALRAFREKWDFDSLAGTCISPRSGRLITINVYRSFETFTDEDGHVYPLDRELG